MPHIHTEKGQHDLTVSAYIIRKRDSGEHELLVHVHKKVKKLMQPGGHVELNETPWEAITHELTEETGYDIKQLVVLQPARHVVNMTNPKVVQHPIPYIVNTHPVESDMENHYHTDLSYVFITEEEPASGVGEGESDTLRWVTAQELRAFTPNEVQSTTQAVGLAALQTASEGVWFPDSAFTR